MMLLVTPLNHRSKCLPEKGTEMCTQYHIFHPEEAAVGKKKKNKSEE